MTDFADEERDPAEPLPDISALVFPGVIEHPDEFVRELTGITAPWMATFKAIRPWFRGMPKISYSLEPSLLRYRPRPLMATESNVERQFHQYGRRLLEHIPGTRLELHAVMQHHGIPTRLLDWSENAFAALYFAVREFEHHNDPDDAVVWLLEPLRLAEIQRQQREVPFAHDQLMDSPQLPVPFYPTHVAARLAPQRSVFTVHPFRPQHALLQIALHEVTEGRLSPLRALRIAGHKRAFIREAMVTAFGSGEFTFFPDLDGLGRELRMRERLEGLG